MMEITGRPIALMITSMLIATVFAGCSGLGNINPNAKLTSDMDEINAGETVNFDARESTTPNPTIIEEYRWDFDDGNKKTTKQGVVSHQFINPGYYSIQVTVVNDQGGIDTEYTSLFVNSPPILVFEVSNVIRTGSTVLLDASESFDPEGGVVSFEWDFDITEDSNNDGDPSNDADATSAITNQLTLIESGNRTGRITIMDDKGATNTSTWTVMVISRTFRIIWEPKHVEFEWNGYLEQGKSYEIIKNPFPESRMISMNSTLTLARDLIPIMWPEDNFSLYLDVPLTGWSTFTSTTHDNITENATAYISLDNMNERPEINFDFLYSCSNKLPYP